MPLPGLPKRNPGLELVNAFNVVHRRQAWPGNGAIRRKLRLQIDVVFVQLNNCFTGKRVREAESANCVLQVLSLKKPGLIERRS
jgi:hypothetical protein